MKRTAFVVDGFNLYHSVVDASESLGFLEERGTKWLDIHGLCASYLSAIGGGAELTGVHYFSALAHHLEASKPDVVARHRHYIACLEGTGVTVELGHFKRKLVKCKHCNRKFTRWEEKETDVAIGAKLLELFFTNSADCVVLVTGDTDVAPAVRTAQQLFQRAEICFAFPWDRKNDDLAKLVTTCIQLTSDAYVRHQFPDPLVIGAMVYAKPSSW